MKTDYTKLLNIELSITNDNKFSLIKEMNRISKGIEYINKSNDINDIKKALKQIQAINDRLMNTIDFAGDGNQVLPAMLVD